MLQRLELSGFRSIKEQKIDFGPINVLVGTNGAGKSNLVSFFRMLAFLHTGGLQQYIARNGGASTLLHYGPRVTPIMTFALEFPVTTGASAYAAHLAHAAGDTLIFVDERVGHKRGDEWQWRSLGAGHQESKLEEYAESVAGDPKVRSTARVIRWNLQRSTFYHFHDTSAEARIRNKGYVEDNRYLRSDAGNLAAYLFRIRQQDSETYSRILRTIKQILPMFGDFDLALSAHDERSIILNWHEQDGDVLFGPHQLSDGALRIIALVTAMLQREQRVAVVIDEPELGLHPYAIAVIGALMRSTAHHPAQPTQMIISTQSITFLDQFEPGEVIVVERQQRGTEFKRLDPDHLTKWLEEYSLGELWEKNVIGGRPSR